MNLFDGDNTGSGYSDFQRQQLLSIAGGAKSLYELVTGDWSNINDRTYRAMITEYRREIETAQDHLTIHQICERVGFWFTDAAVLSGAIRALVMPTSTTITTAVIGAPSAGRTFTQPKTWPRRLKRLKTILKAWMQPWPSADIAPLMCSKPTSQPKTQSRHAQNSGRHRRGINHAMVQSTGFRRSDGQGNY